MNPANPPHSELNRRVLIVDDNLAIHDDFEKVLCPRGGSKALDALEASLFDEDSMPGTRTGPAFEVHHASQGQEALALAKEALAQGAPFAVAFIDIRMPPGWDGVETANHLWAIDPRLQVVICSAYSDYSWEEMRQKLSASQQMLILKKPFDSIEVLQLAHALAEKWDSLLANDRLVAALEAAVESRTQSLAETNHKLLDEMARREVAEADSRTRGSWRPWVGSRAESPTRFNNPLAFITSNLTFIQEVIQELQAPIAYSDDLNQAAADALLGAGRIGRIVRNVKAFAEAEAGPTSQRSLDAILRQAVEDARCEVEMHGTLVVETEGATARDRR